MMSLDIAQHTVFPFLHIVPQVACVVAMVAYDANQNTQCMLPNYSLLLLSFVHVRVGPKYKFHSSVYGTITNKKEHKFVDSSQNCDLMRLEKCLKYSESLFVHFMAINHAKK